MEIKRDHVILSANNVTTSLTNQVNDQRFLKTPSTDDVWQDGQDYQRHQAYVPDTNPLVLFCSICLFCHLCTKNVTVSIHQGLC